MFDRAALKKLRPWYFVLAMCFTWVGGVIIATTSYATFSYLRGEQEVVDRLRSDKDHAAEPRKRMELDYQQARLRALAAQHQRAFPISLAKMLLGVMLTLVSAGAMAGRKNFRGYAIQIAAATLVLTVVAYALQSSVRAAMLQVISEQSVAAFGQMPQHTDDQSRTLYVMFAHFGEWLRFALFELAPPLFALFALTRGRTRNFFEAVEAAEAASEQS